MAAKLVRFAPAAVVLSAAALFTATATTLALASPDRDPLVDASATIESSTMTAETKPGEGFTAVLAVQDNLTGDKGDGSVQCAVVAKDAGTAALISQCTVILRLKNGEVHLSGMVDDSAEKFTGAVIGGTGMYGAITGEAEFTRSDDETFKVVITKPDGVEPADEPADTPNAPVETPGTPAAPQPETLIVDPTGR